MALSTAIFRMPRHNHHLLHKKGVKRPKKQLLYHTSSATDTASELETLSKTKRSIETQTIVQEQCDISTQTVPEKCSIGTQTEECSWEIINRWADQQGEHNFLENFAKCVTNGDIDNSKI